MKLRFLAVGDIHLEKLATYMPDEDYITPVTKTLKRIWKYAREEGIEHVIILGDIFDNPYPKDDAKKAFLKCLDKNLQYYIILGNHDVATIEENSLTLCKYFIEDLGLMDNVKFFLEPQAIDIQGVRFDMLPYPHKKPISPAPAICIGHFEAKGYQADNGKIFKDGTELDESYTWILGHLHRKQGKVYPGSVTQTKFGEPVNKYFFDCTVLDNGQVQIEEVSINTPFKLIDLVANKLDDIKLEEDNIYRIFASDHLDLSLVTEACRGYRIWQIKGISKEDKKVELTETDVEYQKQNLADEVVYLRTWLENPDNTNLTQEQVDKAVTIVENIKKEI